MAPRITRAIGIFANSACVASLTLRKFDRPFFPKADVQIAQNPYRTRTSPQAPEGDSPGRELEAATYAEALAKVGMQVRHLPCRGQIHMSSMAVDMVVSGAAARAEMGAAFRQFFDA